MTTTRLVQGIAWLAIALLLFALAGFIGPGSNDYRDEWAKTESDLLRHLDHAGDPSNDPDLLLRKTYLYFLKASLTGDRRDLALAETQFNHAIQSPASSPDLVFLHVAFNLKRHKLQAAKAGLARVRMLDESPKVQALDAEIDVQEGRYSAAEQTFRALIEQQPAWENLARLAYLRWKAGDFEAAERLYQEAEEEISAKEMRSYAWVQLQRGQLALSRGRYREAAEYYRRADQAYSGYWLVQDHRAELLAAERNFDAAIALYRGLLTCSRRPEILQALGDLYSFMGQPDSARPWYDEALAEYLDATRRGEVQYYHHLAVLYADGLLNGAEAVRWARKDIEVRRNVGTHDTLAWALYRDGRYAPALDEMQKALGAGWQDAHLFFHAAMIHLAAGRIEQGKGYLQKAAEINPRYDSFHVHR
ncbi:MAG: tetratricopeptide repeat protein [Methylococcaceae bacterium]|nr:tetratricopeptide repeat protein [Methylococcaceae bacterium]